MKKFKYLFIVLSLVTTASCSVTKRHYRPGFHLERKHKLTVYRAENESANSVNKELNQQLDEYAEQKEDYFEKASDVVIEQNNSSEPKLVLKKIEDGFDTSSNETIAVLKTSAKEETQLSNETNEVKDSAKKERSIQPFVLAGLVCLLACLTIGLILPVFGIILYPFIFVFEIIGLVKIAKYPKAWSGNGLAVATIVLALTLGLLVFIAIVSLLSLTEAILISVFA